MGELEPGLSAEVGEVVSERLTALALGSGQVAVYATPAMIALMERASVAAVQPCLAPGQTSVGVEVSVKHLAATPVGVPVRARAEVTAVTGRMVSFAVEAWDAREKIGAGTHTRVIVETQRFVEKAQGKSGT